MSDAPRDFRHLRYLSPDHLEGPLAQTELDVRDHADRRLGKFDGMIFDPMTVFAFAGLTTWAIVKRRQTEWHRALRYTIKDGVIYDTEELLADVRELVARSFGEDASVR